MMHVDLNCDMGESSGSRIVGEDASIMPLISSANIACGYHGGDALVMDQTVTLAIRYGVNIGAHPSFFDLEHFGRREMDLSEAQIGELVTAQVSALMRVAAAQGARLSHVKPHGALYNMSARNFAYARAIARAVKAIDPGLVLFGLSGSLSIRAAEDEGLRHGSEVFADRTYQDDGSLTPRTSPHAMISEVSASVEQVLMMVREGKVRALSGKLLNIQAETICIHGDTAGAAAYARAIRQGLEAAGVTIQPFTI
jgi:5-oxoprolinase (ATP-hydrolysing) subunit A